jgi:hypothetical protein
MKYFVGKKFNTKNFIEKKRKLEEVLSKLGIEKATTNDSELQSKINGDICRNLISLSSIIPKFLKYITLFLEDNNQNMIGFLIFDINEKDSSIEIHYLCSNQIYKGNGKLMLDQIKEIAKESSISQITLTPGLHINVIKYYENNGFVQDGWVMIYKVTTGGKKTTTQNRMRKNRMRKNSKQTRKRKGSI